MEEKGDVPLVTVVIKNPSRSHDSLSFELPGDSTLGNVREVISQRYEGRPSPSEQTLIFAGKVLKDFSVKLSDLANSHNLSPAILHIHLVVRSTAVAAASSESSAVGNTKSTASGASTSTSVAGATTDPTPSTSQPTFLSSASSSTGYQSSSSAGPSTSSTPQQTGEPQAQPQAQGQAQGQTNDPGQMYPYLFVNPVYAAAYHAAYAAALATANNLQRPSGSQTPSAGAPAFLPSFPLAFYYPGMLASAVHPPGVPQPPGSMPFAPAVPFGYMPMSFPGLGQAVPPGQVPVAAAAEFQHGSGLRQRVAPATPPQIPPQHQHQAQRPQHRPRRHYQIVFRISARTLLQILVFAVFLYQHFTWTRFVLLMCGSVILYVTANWAPLRNFMFGMGGPPRANPQAAPNNPQQRGILREIALVVIGFITSLLPAWNYNPEDAAAFAAAQEAVAREQRNADAVGGAEQPEQEGGPPQGAGEHQD